MPNTFEWHPYENTDLTDFPTIEPDEDFIPMAIKVQIEPHMKSDLEYIAHECDLKSSFENAASGKWMRVSGDAHSVNLFLNVFYDEYLAAS